MEFRFADGSTRLIQVNACKNPSCANYGVPVALARFARRSKAPPGTKGTQYMLAASGKGLPTLHCLLCGEYMPIKSNIGIAEELGRIASYVASAPAPSCPDVACRYHGVAVSRFGYQAFGKTTHGSQRYRCRACGRTFTVGARPTLRQRMPHKNLAVFKLLLNKMPISRICEVADIAPKTFYDKLDFIHRQALALASQHERKLLEGYERRRFYVSVDRQDYAVNWSGQKDKTNVVLRAIGSADTLSGYVFGMHLNFDPSLNAEAVERDAMLIGDHSLPAPHRRYARLWLTPDYIEAIANSAERIAKRVKDDDATIGDEIVGRYEEAIARTDIESPELVTVGESLPKDGMQVHNEYTMYAHFFWLRQLFRNVEKVRFFMDQESGIRAACLSAFEQEIRDRRCDAFYVQLGKEMTVDQKRHVIDECKAAFKRIADAHPSLSRDEVQTFMMKQEMARAAALGKWRDRWLRHPLPNAAEPLKAACYLTDFGDMDEDHLARLYLLASLHSIDRFFMQIRRRLSLLERPFSSASKKRRIWSGYSAYRPGNIEKVLNIFRVYYNYCLAGRKDKKTPAMRLGLVDHVVTPAAILHGTAIGGRYT